ncbi:regulatory protein, luxR family [Actinacidiphila yanglinensis]|uniref:Regulatory protein, luxR family n=1 Tax=Actinacidiphila yanglinensis TaxID=310779 RepID=A0A1H6E2F8_9ACTN|nr:helix-turn-helix transcriptional regulator [Actinacidiphila yanglinensis]SEG91810.1 regulatory protein, luxR family [Actinacidiphila yanglinensis]
MSPKSVDRIFEVYEWSLSRDGFGVDDIANELGFKDLGESEKIVAKLLELQLIEPSREQDAWFVPTDPTTASSQLLNRSELDLLERKLEAAQLRDDLARLSLLFRTSKFGSQHTNSFDILKVPETIRLMISEAAANSSHEVVCMQPRSGWPAEGSPDGETLDFQVLAPGVSLRVLYQHAARFDMPTREQAAALVESGAEIRTAGALFGNIFIFDRTTAYILASSQENGAVVVQERSLVDFLLSCFEYVWATAKEFDTRRAETDVISGDMKREIVKMLISGAKDEAIARRLGVSVRTCRKHIGQVMQMFGATSRFQFGYLVREATLVEDL